MKILVIRRDNIGDLVCTTPLLRSLRRQLPDARIEVLATRYNAPVLAGNPDINALHVYTKAKHRASGESRLRIYTRRIAQILELRRRRFDWVLLPGGTSSSAQRFARWIKPEGILGEDTCTGYSDAHEVERCCRLLVPLGLAYDTPALQVVPNAEQAAALRCKLEAAWFGMPRRLVALHLSARKPSQRWPAERFAELARRLHETDKELGFLLLWAPGSEDNRLHPGDDEKAASVLAATGPRVHPIPTASLEELIAALSLCDILVCGDGGAMHIGAGLGKPIVALFGQSDPARWRPWGVTQRVLQAPSRDVADIGVQEVFDAVQQVMAARPANEEHP